MHNCDCDGSHCQKPDGEVRLLPTGGSSNLILCHACYLHEIRYRKERNRDLGLTFQFSLPRWEDLEVYNVTLFRKD